jgi:hypothetical protein
MQFGFLSKHFPPPKFLKPEYAGISFSDSNIKAIYFDKGKSKPNIKNLNVSLEAGAIVGGNILNPESVIKSLSNLEDGFGGMQVFFTVPDELVYIYSVKIPVASGKDVSESVAFTIEENVPVSLSDAVFDFLPFEVMEEGEAYLATFIVAVSVKREVEKYVQVLKESGFEPLGCIHESQAAANTLINKKSTGSTCIVNATKNRLGLYLAIHSAVVFSNIVPVSADGYKKQFLGEYEKFLEYSIKHDIGGNKPAEQVLVCGEFEYAKKAVETIVETSSFTKNAKLGNVWTNVLSIEKNAPSISFEDSLGLAEPIGAVLSEII